jgi:transposase
MTEAFLEGHVRAFAYFGGVPTPILYDNSKIAAARMLGGEERRRYGFPCVTELVSVRR